MHESVEDVSLDISMIQPPESTFENFALTTEDQVITILESIKSNGDMNIVNRDAILDLVPVCLCDIDSVLNRRSRTISVAFPKLRLTLTQQPQGHAVKGTAGRALGFISVIFFWFRHYLRLKRIV